MWNRETFSLAWRRQMVLALRGLAPLLLSVRLVRFLILAFLALTTISSLPVTISHAAVRPPLQLHATLAAQTDEAGRSTARNDSPAPRSYTLPPQTREKAIHRARSRHILYFAGAIWGIIFLFLWLQLRGNAALRNWVASLTPNRTLQGWIFLPLFLLALTLASLPIELYSHQVERLYGLSIQSWGSWFGDWAKSTALMLFFGTLVMMFLYRVIRMSPRRWWIYFWLGCLPFILLTVLVIPVLIDPLFNHFEPLTQSNQPLVDQLERVVARTGTEIPPNRMFLMKASEKVTSLNAYVTGIGASKRVVVWDTTITKAPVDDILFIFGHESGHYVLNHIYKGIAFFSLILLVFLWIGYQLTYRIIQIYGPAWRVPAIEDWSSAAVLVLLFSILSFLSEPVQNSFSRMEEHDADVFGQECLHTIVAEPRTVVQDSFQRLGEVGLAEPDPSPFIVFWTYSHPSIADRMEFAGSYNPWAPGQEPKYFKKN